MIELAKRCLTALSEAQFKKPHPARRGPSNLKKFKVSWKNEKYDVALDDTVFFSLKDHNDSMELEIRWFFIHSVEIKKDHIEEFIRRIGYLYEENLEVFHYPKMCMKEYEKLNAEVLELISIYGSNKLPKVHNLGILD